MTTDQAPDPKLERVLRIPEASRGRHSPLYSWMKRNYRALEAEFREHGPRWEARVKAMKAAGLVDWNRKPPTIRTAQQTWYRLRRDMAKATATPETTSRRREVPPHLPEPAPEPAPAAPAPSTGQFATGDPALDRALNAGRTLKPLPPMGKMDTQGRRSKPTKGEQDDGENG